MDNWSRGWRKIVEWDSINKVYLYKGYKIIPLSYSDQIKLPNHLQNEYYWGEISHIQSPSYIPTDFQNKLSAFSNSFCLSMLEFLLFLFFKTLSI